MKIFALFCLVLSFFTFDLTVLAKKPLVSKDVPEAKGLTVEAFRYSADGIFTNTLGYRIVDRANNYICYSFGSNVCFKTAEGEAKTNSDIED